MKFLKRFRNWNKNDWGHTWFLLKSILHGFWMADIHEIVESYMWLKFHLRYEGHLVYQPGKINHNNTR